MEGILESNLTDQLRRAFIPKKYWSVLHEALRYGVEEANSAGLPFIIDNDLKGYFRWKSVHHQVKQACDLGTLPFKAEYFPNNAKNQHYLELVPHHAPNVTFLVCHVTGPNELPVTQAGRLEKYESNLDLFKPNSILPIRTGVITYVATDMGLTHISVVAPHVDGKSCAARISITDELAEVGESAYPTEETEIKTELVKRKIKKEQKDGNQAN